MVVPAGTYTFTSRLHLPNGVNITGAGPSSWIDGPVTVASGSSYSDLRIGVQGYSTYIGGVQNVTFNGVEFSGGGGANSGDWPFYDCNAVTIGTGSDGQTSGIAFTNCQFDSPMATEDSTRSLHYDSIFVTAAINVTFTGCHWDTSQRFQVEIWDDTTNGSRNVNFSGCAFEQNPCANVDYSTFNGGYSTVQNCSFKGDGCSSTPEWPDGVTIEKGASHITVDGCTFLRGRDCFVGGSGSYNVVTNNTCVNPASPAIIHNWMPYIALSGSHNTVSGNTIVCAASDPHPGQVYIDLSLDNSTITNNSLVTPGGQWSGAWSVGGTGNTVSGNTWNGTPQ